MDSARKLQAQKSAVGADFTNATEKETQFFQLGQLAIFLAPSFVAGLTAAVAKRSWDRQNRIVDWRKDWMRSFLRKERIRVKEQKAALQIDKQTATLPIDKQKAAF